MGLPHAPPLVWQFRNHWPKAQLEALFTKLLVQGLSSDDEPWKEILRHRVDRIQLPVHGKGPINHDINWFFDGPKL
jgi:hypothetical protein